VSWSQGSIWRTNERDPCEGLGPPLGRFRTLHPKALAALALSQGLPSLG